MTQHATMSSSTHPRRWNVFGSLGKLFQAGGLKDNPAIAWSLYWVVLTGLMCVSSYVFMHVSKALDDSSGGEKVIEPDSFFAAITILLSVFLPVALDKYKERMRAQYNILCAKRKLMKLLDPHVKAVEPNVFKNAFDEFYDEYLRGKQKVADFVDNDKIATILKKSDKDYVQDAVSELLKALYELDVIRKYDVDRVYPDVILFALFAYFGILMPIYNGRDLEQWIVLQTFLQGGFCNLIFILAARDLAADDRAHLQALDESQATSTIRANPKAFTGLRMRYAGFNPY